MSDEYSIEDIEKDMIRVSKELFNKNKKSFKMLILEKDEENPGYILGIKHWGYIEKLLRTHGEDEKIIEKIKFHYVQAMKHGYKHGLNHEQKG